MRGRDARHLAQGARGDRRRKVRQMRASPQCAAETSRDVFRAT
jgi:hypothetical protein